MSEQIPAVEQIPAEHYDELAKLRAMHAALADLARDHSPACCGYCASLRRRLDAVLAVGPATTPADPRAKCARWK